MENYQSINNDEDSYQQGTASPLNTNRSNAATININDNATPPTTTTTTNNIHQEQDHLTPPFRSPLRPSTLLIGTFNLIATIIGGGVLSLPIVFQKCGVAFTTLAMILLAYMTYMTLLMLCYCSRRCGGSSYGEVVRSAFGTKMEEGVSLVLCVYLILGMVAYQILIRDIWTPLIGQVFMMFNNGDGVDIDGDYVLLGITVLLLPLLCQRSLHALRKMCYIGFASIIVLCIALCHGGIKGMTNAANTTNTTTEEDETGEEMFHIEYFKIPSPRDLLFCFPIVTSAFVCHFNIIAIQNALSKPTRERMQNLIGYSITVCFLLMYIFGLAGYIYGGNGTQGNILLNVPMERVRQSSSVNGDNENIDADYYIFLLGRIGCGITIMLVMPMTLLPCREALLEVVDVRFHRSHHRSESGNAREEQCCWKVFHECNSSESVQDAEITTEDELLVISSPRLGPSSSTNIQQIANDTQPRDIEAEDHHHHPNLERQNSFTVLLRHDTIQKDYVFRNTLAHYGSTFLITAACYLGAVAVRGVAVVWSFIGSSMAFLIAFILPCGCFIVMESAVPRVADGGDRKERWIGVAWMILVFSMVGMVVCTINNTVGFKVG